jgi:phage regulator Rha-like protein
MSPDEAVHDLGRMIITIRDMKVVLDSDLALIYGVETKTLNRAVKRNPDRFPQTFMFRLEPQEFTDLKCQIGTSSSYGGRRKLPYVFTEHGALMAANVLNSTAAVKMSVALIEAFVRLRQELATTQALARKLAEIEKTVISHDRALVKLFEAIRPLLMPPPEGPRKEIGFHAIKEKKQGTEGRLSRRRSTK